MKQQHRLSFRLSPHRIAEPSAIGQQQIAIDDSRRGLVIHDTTILRDGIATVRLVSFVDGESPMSVAQHNDSGTEGQGPDMRGAWPVAGALVTFVATWRLTHDPGIALAAASAFLAAFLPRWGPTRRD
jgi:hypothetical protein